MGKRAKFRALAKHRRDFEMRVIRPPKPSLEEAKQKAAVLRAKRISTTLECIPPATELQRSERRSRLQSFSMPHPGGYSGDKAAELPKGADLSASLMTWAEPAAASDADVSEASKAASIVKKAQRVKAMAALLARGPTEGTVLSIAKSRAWLSNTSAITKPLLQGEGEERGMGIIY
jgi:hypothetical protein